MRSRYIQQIVEAAEALNYSDPTEASELLRVVGRLSGTREEEPVPMHVGASTEAPPRSEYEVGYRDGKTDRLVGRRIRDQILSQLYGRQYIEGYASGWCVEPEGVEA